MPSSQGRRAFCRSLSKAGGDAAVDVENVAVDEAGRVGGEEDRRADEFLDVAPTAERRAAGEPGGEFLVLDKRLVELGAEIARREAR